MNDLLETWLPNVSMIWPEVWDATYETLYMVIVGAVIGYAIGLVLGLLLLLTRRGGLTQNVIVYNILDKIVNIVRSIPFIILMALLVGVTRVIVGTSIGTEAMIRPRGPQGEQAALSGQGQQGAGGSDQDLPVRLCRHQRGGGLTQPGGKQVAGKENAIWRAGRPRCHLPRLPFAKQQPPAVSPVLPGLQRRLPGGAPERTLDQQIHSFPHIRPPGSGTGCPGGTTLLSEAA